MPSPIFDLVMSGATSALKPETKAAAQPTDGVFDALLIQESGGRQLDKSGAPITSKAGAIGIAQVMPGTAPEAAALAGLPWDEAKYRGDADYNKALGKAYFDKQLTDFGDVPKALAAYNAGPGAVRRALSAAQKSGQPDAWLSYLPEETRNYVPAIMGRSKTSMAAASTAAAAVGSAPRFAPGNEDAVAAGSGVKGPTAGDFGREFAASFLTGIGSIGQFVGEGAALVANAVTGTEEYAGKNLLDPAAQGVRAGMTEGGKAALQAAEIKGDILDPSTWVLPDTTEGWAMIAANGLGSVASSLLPMVGPAARVASLAKAGKAAEAAAAARTATVIGAISGGAQTGGSAAQEVRETTQKAVDGMTHEQLLSGVPVYAQALNAGADEATARAAVVNGAARLAGGLASVAGAAGGAFNAKIIEGLLLKNGISKALGAAGGGVAGRAAVGVAGGVVAEGGQEGAEKFGQNVGENIAMGRPALEDATRNTAGDVFAGALTGGLIGGPVGAGSTPQNPAALPAAIKAQEPNTPLSKAATAGNIATEAQGPAPAPVEPGQRLAELEAVGQQGGVFTPEQQQEYEALKGARDATPGAVPDEITPKAIAIRDQLRANRGVLDALRAEGSPFNPQSFLKDLSIASSKSAQPAMREQALTRVEMALEWAGANPAPAIEADLDSLPGLAQGEARPDAPRPTATQLRAGADRDAELLAERDGAPANDAGNRTRAEADRREQAAIDIESGPAATAETLDRAVALRQQAAVLRRRADDLDAQPGAAGTAGAMTERDRAGIDEQRQTNLERNMRAPAAEGAATAKTSPASVSAEDQARLEAAALAGGDQIRRREDDPRQVVIDRAMRNIEERGGVASPAEARILQEAGAGKPYDRIDESLSGELSTDEKLTQATGIALGRAPRETVSQGRQDEAALASTEQQARSDSRMQRLADERAAAAAGRDQAQARPPAGAPPADNVIAALRTIPALRSAEQKAVVDAARARMTAEQMRVLQDAASNPANLSATDKLQLQQMRAAEARRSAERDGDPQVVENDELGDGSSTAFFDEEAYIIFRGKRGSATLSDMASSEVVRGRDMLRWFVGRYGKPRVVDVVPSAVGFWEKMQREGLIRSWSPISLRSSERTDATQALPDVAIPAGDGPAFLRKRKAQIKAAAAQGFETVERRDGVFVMRNAKTGAEVRLSGRADAALAREAIRKMVDERAHAAATSPKNDRKEPSWAQIDAINWKKGDPIQLNGVTVRIENPVGSIRRARPDAPVQWKTTMKHHYGEIAGTKGVDGDPVDVFVGPNPASSKIWVIDQVTEDGKLDEHKVMFGFDSEAAARAGYLSNFSSGWKGLGKITEMTQDEFRAWIKDQGATMAPAAEAVAEAEPAADIATAVEPETGSFTVRMDGKDVTFERRGVDALGEKESPERDGRATRISKKSAALIKAIAQALGKKVVFFADVNGVRPGDGFVVPNEPDTIYLNEVSTINPLAVMGHEFLHTLRQTNPEAWNAIAAVVKARVKDPKGFRRDYYGAEEAEARGDGALDESRGGELEELVSDLGGNLMADPKFWEDVFAKIRADNGKDAKGIIARLMATLQAMIDKIAGVVKGPKYKADGFVTELGAIRAAYRDGLASYLMSSGESKAGIQAEVLKAAQKDPETALLRTLEREHAAALRDTGFWGKSGAGSLVISRKTGRVLLPLRSRAVLEPGTWGTWGGAIDANEDPKAAALRELQEEAGISGNIEMIPAYVFQKGGFKYHNFIAVVDDEVAPTLDWETERAEWVPHDKLPTNLHPGLRALIADKASTDAIASVAKKAAAAPGAPSDALNLTGYHFSQQPRKLLSSETHGQGLQDANREQFQQADDPRIRQRIYFYVDKGTGITPLPGLGTHAHRAPLTGVYDMNKDALGLRKGKRLEAFESAVLDAGYSGYLDRRDGTQPGVVVMLGKRSVAPEYLGVRASIKDGDKVPGAVIPDETPQTLSKGLMSNEMGAVEVANIPGAKMRAGILTIPANSREQANAEMARIGSPIRFSAERAANPYAELRGEERKKFMAEQKELGVDLYKSGLSVREVSSVLGTFSPAAVKRWLHKAGEIRSMAEAQGGTPARRLEAARLYQEGLGAKEIARQLGGVTDRGVYGWLKSAGVQMRSLSEAQAMRAAQGRQNIRGVRSVVATKWGPIRADSVYEAARLRQLELDDAVKEVRRSVDVIPWGGGRLYSPDLIVESIDGSVRVEEIKPTFQKSLPEVLAKAKAATEFLSEKGIEYRIVDTNDLLDAFDLLVGARGIGFASDEDAVRFKISLKTARSAAKAASTVPMRSTERGGDDVAEQDELDGIRRAHEEAGTFLLAPNGRQSNLSERQWLHVRSASFKKWFGPWEEYAAAGKSVWLDDSGEVSKAVDSNGEPRILYHGTDHGGFSEFQRPGGVRRGDLGIFTTDDAAMAMSYVHRRRARMIGRSDINNSENDESTPGVYALFLNIRNPHESDFEGANWDGSRAGQFMVVDDDGEQIYGDDGRGYFADRDDAFELVMKKGGTIEEAMDHYETTDGVTKDARRSKNDGAIIRQVVDDGGGSSSYYGEPNDLFVAFEPNQVKSAAFNEGDYSVDSDDIRFSVEHTHTRVHEFEVSTRTPYAKATKTFAPEDARANLLISDFAAGLGQEKWLSAVTDLVETYPNYRAAPSATTPEKKLERMVRQMVENLVWLHDQVPASTRSRSKLWYDGARAIAERWVKKYDITDAQAAGMLAVLSPQKDWFMNVSLANRVADILSERQAFRWSKQMDETASRIFGKDAYDEDIAAIRGETLQDIDDPYLRAMWLRVYDQAHNPASFYIVSPEGDFIAEARTKDGTLGRVAWGGNSTIAKAVSIFEDGSFQNISDSLGRMHKVRNFYNNILVPNSPNGHVTIDTHAVAAALLRALSGNSLEVKHNFSGPSSAHAGLKGSYALYEEAYRRAAAERGILPREMQSITWEAIRGLYVPTFKAQKRNVDAVDAAWEQYSKGRLSYEKARQQVFELGGRIDPPSWEGRDPGAYVEDEEASDDGDLAEDGVSAGAAEADGRGAGRRAGASARRSAERGDGDRAGRQEGRGLAPLAGAPAVQGAAGPDPRLVEVARLYAAANGIPLRRQAEYVKVDPDRAARIAAAYEAMPHSPTDKKVRAAYEDMIRQTRAQYDALIEAGYEFTFFDGGSDPYKGNPWNAMRDLRANKRMAVYGTYDGYGTEGITQGAIADNPMLADTGLRWKDQAGVDRPVVANDLFRAVHDAFGHGLEGAGFRADGEENAWQAHVRLFTGPAVGAITSETRGQNSWLNYGPAGEKNRGAKVEDTVFADQKTGLMPEWTWADGRAGDATKSTERQTETPEFKRWFGDSKVVDAQGKPLVVLHGTTKDFDEFRRQPKGSHASSGLGFFFTIDEFSAESFGERIVRAYLSIQNPYTMTATEFARRFRGRASRKSAEDFAENLARAGYDGIYLPARGLGETDEFSDSFADTWVAFESTQIKSVFNRGTFDPANPDITKSSERDLDNFRKELLGRVSANVAMAKMRGAGHDWAFNIGDQLLSTKTGKVYTLTGRIFQRVGKLSANDWQPVYYYEAGDGEKGTFPEKNILASTTLKSLTTPIMRSAERPWYSQLERAIEGVPARLDNMAAPQWAQWLKANASKLGVKQDEITWSGIEDWLKLKGKEKVSKEEIGAYLAEGGVRVEEVVLGDSGESLSWGVWSEYDDNAERFMEAKTGERIVEEAAGSFDVYSRDGDIVKGGVIGIDRAKSIAATDAAGQDIGGTPKYSQYTLPGGQNYREVLLTLPEKPKESWLEFLARRGMNLKQYSELPLSERRIMTEVHMNQGSSPGNYKSSHWDQKNVVSHVRLDDRTDADGARVLMIQEIQSDWSADGRKKGFAGGDVDAERRALMAEANDVSRAPPTPERLRQIQARLAELARGSKSPTAVPTGPFVTDTKAYVTLALKRVIKMAADEGYDKVALITGDQAAELFDLSKQVSKVRLIQSLNIKTGEPSSIGSLFAYDLNGKESVSKLNLESEAQIEELIGKELAGRLLQAKPKDTKEIVGTTRAREISGLDLKIGGEGLRSYYNQIVMQVARDLVKKMGGEGMTTVRIGNPDAARRLVVDELPQGGWGIYDEEGDKWLAENDTWVDDAGDDVEVYSKKAAESYAAAIMRDGKKGPSLPQPGFTITDAMREKAAGGMPLFSRERAAWTDERIDTLLNKYAYTQGDGSTTKAYAGWVSPDNFLAATTPMEERPRLEAESKKLDREELAKQSQEIFLIVEPKRGRLSIAGHEGRHRMAALQREGVARVPVVFVTGKVERAEPRPTQYLPEQEWGDTAGEKGFMTGPLTPISYKYANELREKFGGDGDVRFSLERTNTPEFKAWFGNSKVVDEDGAPLEVYHATTGDFSNFIPGGIDPTVSGPAIWLTDSKDNQPAAHNTSARTGFRDGTNVMPLYVKMERPLLIDDKQMLEWAREVFAGGSREFPQLMSPKTVAELTKDGEYDGIIFDGPALGWKGAVREYIVFDGSKVKSVFNDGTFGPGSDILRSRDRTGTPEFKAWFKDSKVVDASGLPLVMYHGTTNDFGAFDPSTVKGGLGFHFGTASSANDRLHHLRKNPDPKSVMPVYLSIKNPLRLADLGLWHTPVVIHDLKRLGILPSEAIASLDGGPQDDVEGGRAIVSALEAAGYDGIVYRNIFEGAQRGLKGRDISEIVEARPNKWFGKGSGDAFVAYFKDSRYPVGGSGGATADEAMESARKVMARGKNAFDDSYIAFRPEQIKSAIGNDGSFDETDPNILSSAERAWATPGASKFDDVVYKMQDKQVDLKRIVEAVKNARGEIRNDLDTYLQEELFHGRAAKRTEDFVNKELQPLVDEMAKRGLTIEDLDEYLHARHAPEANRLIAERNPDVPGLQDGGSGLDTAFAQAYMADLPADKRDHLAAAAAMVDKMLAKTRKLVVDYELEGKDTVNGWGEMFDHYVPLMREDDGDAPQRLGTGQGFSIKGREVKSRTGSTKKVVDILANIAMQRERTIVRGEKNRVAQSLVGLASANPNKDFWTVDLTPTTPTFDPKKGVVVQRPDPMFKARPNVVVAKIREDDGSVKEHAVIFSEKDGRALRTATAMKNLDAAQLEGLMGASATITRYFAAVNTQYNPVFGIVNLVRDVQGALINLQTTELAGKQKDVAKNTLSALRGIYTDARAVRGGKSATSAWAALWEDFQDVGGQTGFRQLFATSNDRAEAIQKALNPDAWMDSKLGKIFTARGTLRVPLAVAMKGARWIFDWLSDYNLAMENGIRLATYKAGLDAGMSKERAASVAKNLTVNFNRKGQIGQQAGAVYAFFNASMQGTARLGQVLFDMEPGKPKTMRLSSLGKKVVYGGIALGSMQALALAAAGFDDNDPPDFARERALIIPTGGKTYVSIPMPLGFHVIPGIGRMTTEWALGGFKDTPQRMVKMLGMFADTFNPIGNAGLSMQTLAPTALDPLVALTENKDWQGRPIAKESMNKAMPGHALARDTDTSWARLISEAVNTATGGDQYVAGSISPTASQIDYLLGQLTGGVGRELSKAEQTVKSSVTGEELPLYKIPVVGRFAGNAASQSSEGNAFYATSERLNRLETEIKGLQKDGKMSEAAALRASRPDAYLIAQANAAERQIAKLRRQKSELLKEGAERDRVRAIEQQITARMAALNRAAAELAARQ